MDFTFPALPSPSTYRAALAGLPAMIPAINVVGAIETGTQYSTGAARTLGFVERPVSAAASGLRVSPLSVAARTLSRGLTAVVIGASIFQGANVVAKGGAGALVNTKEGRSALFGGIGGALLLVPTPATQLGGAGALALAAGNEFGWLRFLDRPTAPVSAPVAASAAV